MYKEAISLLRWTPVFNWRIAHMLLKKAGKMRWILKAQFIRHFTYFLFIPFIVILHTLVVQG